MIQPSRKMLEALENVDEEVRAMILNAFEKQDDEGKHATLEFFDGSGPDIVRQLLLKINDGTPTSKDLGEQFRI